MYILPDLPYDYDALDPTVSGATLRLHHDKHHAAYVKKANDLADKAGLAGRSLEDVIGEARAQDLRPLFNNAAQAWNHAFFWQSMTARSVPPSGSLAAAIRDGFGGLDGLRKAFVEEGAGHFASGWVWLVWDGQLKVISTHDAEDTVGRDGGAPLLVCDLWEHAYYLDYKNDRPGFLGVWFDGVANWSFVDRQFKAARGEGTPFAYPKT